MLLLSVRLISRPLLACKCGNNLLLLLLLLLLPSSNSSSGSDVLSLLCYYYFAFHISFSSVSLPFFGGIEVGTKKIFREDSQHAAQDSNGVPSG
jgi:hypothetical protein